MYPPLFFVYAVSESFKNEKGRGLFSPSLLSFDEKDVDTVDTILCKLLSCTPGNKQDL